MIALQCRFVGHLRLRAPHDLGGDPTHQKFMRLDLFRLSGRGTTWQREILGGTTTFMTMGYIIFVQSTILQAAGMDPGAVMVATCLASALATFCMGLLANYPIALAPRHGTQRLFLLHRGPDARLHLAASARCYLHLRSPLPDSFLLWTARASHQGFARQPQECDRGGHWPSHLIGRTEWSGIVTDHPGTLVGLGDLTSPPVLLSLFGVAVTTILLARGWKTAIFIGILASVTVGLLTGLIHYQGIIGPTPSLTPTLFQLDIPGALEKGMSSIIVLIFLLDLFDTVGTLSGVSQQAGLLQTDGSLPRAGRAFFFGCPGNGLRFPLWDFDCHQLYRECSRRQRRSSHWTGEPGHRNSVSDGPVPDPAGKS